MSLGGLHSCSPSSPDRRLLSAGPAAKVLDVGGEGFVPIEPVEVPTAPPGPKRPEHCPRLEEKPKQRGDHAVHPEEDVATAPSAPQLPGSVLDLPAQAQVVATDQVVQVVERE